MPLNRLAQAMRAVSVAPLVLWSVMLTQADAQDAQAEQIARRASRVAVAGQGTEDERGRLILTEWIEGDGEGDDPPGPLPMDLMDAHTGWLWTPEITDAHYAAVMGEPQMILADFRGRATELILLPKRDGEKRGALGYAMPTIMPLAMPELEVVGQLTRPIPAAEAGVGDRVVFRPDASVARECVLMRESNPALYYEALRDGSMDIIAVRGTDPANARDQLLARYQHPTRHLALVR